MVIELKPETEALILRDLQHGSYGNVAEYVEQAVARLHEELHDEEEWLSANRQQISADLEAGWASAQRGDLIDAEQVELRMAEMKREWLAERHG